MTPIARKSCTVEVYNVVINSRIGIIAHDNQFCKCQALCQLYIELKFLNSDHIFVTVVLF